MRFAIWMAALALTIAAGCDEPETTIAPAAEARASADGERCEHGVLRAVCTKCNPALIAVFQAKGDWCEEHGFPESFCPICHPEREGKPVTDVATDGAPSDGTKVRLKNAEIAGKAGIKTAVAEARPGGARISAVATIEYDATKVAEVNARSPGVLREIRADIGAQVKAGVALATIESAEVGADQSRVQAALSRLRVAEEGLKREQQLLDKGISAKKEVLAAEQEVAAARADLAAAQSAIGMVGRSEGAAGRYVVTAPINGTVTRRTATIGRLVNGEEALFTIADTSKVWVEIDVPEADLPAIQAGQEISVSVDGLDDRTFKATIDYVAPEIDPKTRSGKARASLPNADGALKVNMYGRAEISLGKSRETVLVPRSAVQRAKGVALVFVKKSDTEFETRRVKIGISAGDQIEILRGIEPGEPVATEGSFLLKTETLKGSIGAGCCAGE